jgi:hypothetical protein
VSFKVFSHFLVCRLRPFLQPPIFNLTTSLFLSVLSHRRYQKTGTVLRKITSRYSPAVPQRCLPLVLAIARVTGAMHPRIALQKKSRFVSYSLASLCPLLLMHSQSREINFHNSSGWSPPDRLISSHDRSPGRMYSTSGRRLPCDTPAARMRYVGDPFGLMS